VVRQVDAVVAAGACNLTHREVHSVAARRESAGDARPRTFEQIRRRVQLGRTAANLATPASTRPVRQQQVGRVIAGVFARIVLFLVRHLSYSSYHHIV
jgi:hypothetical protein